MASKIEKPEKMSTKRAIVLGKHGTHKRVFLIAGGRVTKERSTEMYLKYGWREISALGYWEGGFHFK